MRAAVLYRGEDGMWIAECPSLPGCITFGKDVEEALAMAKEAIEGYIECLKEHGEEVATDEVILVKTITVQI